MTKHKVLVYGRNNILKCMDAFIALHYWPAFYIVDDHYELYFDTLPVRHFLSLVNDFCIECVYISPPDTVTPPPSPGYSNK